MKAGWQARSLGDLCNVIGGGTPPKDKPEYYSGDIPWATVRDMRSELITETEFRVTPEAVKSSSTNIIPGGNVVIATRVGLGKVCLLGQDTAINQDLRGIVPINQKVLEVRFLFWWLKSISDVIVAEGTGATVQGVKLPFVKGLQLPLPPLPDQQRIVTLLDEAFDGIAAAKANAEKNLQNARAIFESHLDAVLSRNGAGCTATTLGAEVDLLPGYAFPSGGYTDAIDAVRLLRGDNIMQGYFRWEEAKGWPSGDCESYSRFALQEGDVVIAMDRPWVKAGLKRAQICEDDLPSLLVQRTSRLRTLGRMRMDFLSHLTGSQAFSRHLLEVQTGIGVPHISGKQIESFKFMLPPLSDQESIANTLNDLLANTQRLEEIYEEKLTALDELKKSLLHRAFSGAL